MRRYIVFYIYTILYLDFYTIFYFFPDLLLCVPDFGNTEVLLDDGLVDSNEHEGDGSTADDLCPPRVPGAGVGGHT